MASTSTPKSGEGGGNTSTGGSNMETLKSLFMIGNFITNCESSSDPGNSPDHCVAVKEQITQVVERMSDFVYVMREQMKQMHGQSEALENRIIELETAGKEKDAEIHRLQGKLECEQWEKLETKESIDVLMKALHQFCQNFDALVEGELRELLPSGKLSLKEHVSNAKSKLNAISAGILGKLEQWKESQIAVHEEVKQLKGALGELIDEFKPDLSGVLPSSPNKTLDPPPNEGPSVPKKKVRFSSELVQEKIIGEDESRYDSDEDDAQGNESELEEVDDLDFLELNNLSQPSNFRPFMLENGEYHGWSTSPPSGVAEEEANKKMFWCVCGKGYVVKHVLFRHLLSKQKGKIFKCPRCPKVFALHKSVKRHVRNAHQVEYQEGAFGCRVCGQTYGTAKELYGHRVMEHPGVFRVPAPPKCTPESNEGEDGSKNKRIRTEPPKSIEKPPQKEVSHNLPPDFDSSRLTPGALELLMHLTRD